MILSLALPGGIFAAFTLLDIALWAQGASSAVPFSTMALLLLLWCDAYRHALHAPAGVHILFLITKSRLCMSHSSNARYLPTFATYAEPATSSLIYKYATSTMMGPHPHLTHIKPPFHSHRSALALAPSSACALPARSPPAGWACTFPCSPSAPFSASDKQQITSTFSPTRLRARCRLSRSPCTRCSRGCSAVSYPLAQPPLSSPLCTRRRGTEGSTRWAYLNLPPPALNLSVLRRRGDF